MHQSKDIKKLQELKTLFQNKHLADSLLDIIKAFLSS